MVMGGPARGLLLLGIVDFGGMTGVYVDSLSICCSGNYFSLRKAKVIRG